MYDHEDGGVATYPKTLEVRRDMCEAIARHPGVSADADPHCDRDRWMAIDTALGIVGGQVPDRPVHQPAGTTAIGVLSQVPKPRLQEDSVAALSQAVNAALWGSPRRLEQFLPSDRTIERLLQARGAANQMASEPARFYLRLRYSAILTWAAARATINWSVRRRPLTPLPKWRFVRVREYIDLHIEEPIRPRDLANVAGLSRMHFAARFRAYTGRSPPEFVMMQRIRHAREVLGDPRKTLGDVAFGVGFRTQAHFTTVLHRVVGETPNCWRKALAHDDTQGDPATIRCSRIPT